MSSFAQAVAPTGIDAVIAQPPSRGKPPVVPAPQVKPKPVPLTATPVQPTLEPPDGPPVAALMPFGFYGSIGQFANRVQAVVDAHQAATGVLPKPDKILALAASPTVPTEHLGAAAVPQTPGALAAKTALAQFPTLPDDKLLEGLIGNAHAGGYDAFMENHGAQMDQMLANPATKDKASAALANARSIADFVKTQNAGPGLSSSLEMYGLAPVKAIEWAGVTVHAFGQDLNQVQQYRQSNGQRGSIAFPHLTSASPAVAQIVKGLVYSPAGIFDTGKALTLDLRDAVEYQRSGGKKGSIGFARTTALAQRTGQSMLADLSDPGGRTGYFLLDLWGVASLGVGAAARAGRFGAAVKDGEGVATAARAGAEPHPLKTFVLSKDGLGEQISLSQSPLTAWITEFAPGVGLRARQAKLDARGAPVATTLTGDPIEKLLPDDPIGKATQWVADVLSPERQIGRHGDIRRNTEYKAMLGLKAQLDGTTGSAMRQTALAHLLPGNVLDGLTTGEVKAIQALSWDDPNPLAAEERFHQSMLEQKIGDPAAHKEQIALLALARKALEDPSPRFQKSLDSVARVTAQTQEWRIKLGLGIDTAEERVAKAGAFLREEDLVTQPDGTTGVAIKDANGETVGVVPLNRQSPDSFYSPIYSKGKPQRSATTGPASRGLSQFGLGPAPSLTELKHEMTGDALRSGNYRIDAHNLAGEGYARTAKAIQSLDEWQNAWEHAKPGLPAEGEIAIRDMRTIPDNLRESLSQFLDGHLDQKAVDELPPELHQMLFPDVDKLTEADKEHVRAIDPRLLGGFAKRPHQITGPAKLAEKVNNFLRPLIFYVNPKYALNKIGNEAMLVFDQGFLRSGQNLARAASLDEWALHDDAATIKSLVGASRSRSYVNPSSGPVSAGLADFWNKFTDQGERTASWLYYADRKGYKTPEEIHALLTDPTNKADFLDVNERADVALVGFDKMSQYEKATVRHYLFVYPWTRGAFFWSLRALYEHPAKAALLATMGQDAYQDDPWLKNAPAWVKRVGYIPYYWNGTNPVVGDPTSVNTFSTLAQLLEVAKSAIHGDKYASMGDLLGPPGQFLVHGALGVDQNGNTYKGSQWWGAAKDTLTFLAPYSAYKRSQKPSEPPLKPFDPARRASLEARYNSALKQAVLQPGWLDGFGQIISGGFTGRELNLDAATARYWRTATPAQRHQREVQLLGDALRMQGDYLKQPVPQAVKNAVKDAAQITWSERLFQKANGRNPTTKEKLLLTIKYLRAAGRINPAEEKTLTVRASKLTVVPDITELRAVLLTKYGSMGELAKWDSDVSTLVALTRPAELASRLSLLNQHGLTPQRVYNLTDAQRLDYGRRYIAYLNDRRDLAQQVKGQPHAAAQLAIFDDQNDTAVGQLPSPARLRLVDGPTDKAQARIAQLVNKSWGDLTNAEKAALGRPAGPNMTLAWAAARKTIADIRASGKSVSADGMVANAKLWNRRYPGFMQDWLYAHREKIDRFQATSAYKSLPDKTLFDQWVTVPAKQIEKAVKAGGSKSKAAAVWRAYVADRVAPWLATQPDLEAALKPYGQKVLETLISG